MAQPVPTAPPPTWTITTRDLESAICTAAAKVSLDTAPLRDATVYRLHWGAQVDTRTITETADRDSGRTARVAHPRQVAAYLAKYLTKTTEDFGLPARVRSAGYARAAGASRHAVQLIRAVEHLARQGETYARVSANYATLGYRGHPITKSRGYSVTFGQLRRARRLFHHCAPALALDADIRQVLDDVDDIPDGFDVVADFEHVGTGYLDLEQASAAVRSAALARTR